MAAWRERAFGARDDVRLPDAATLHVTLAFLGYRPEKEIELIGSLLRDACAGRERPELAAKEVMPLPPRRPRLFALDLADFVQRPLGNNRIITRICWQYFGAI